MLMLEVALRKALPGIKSRLFGLRETGHSGLPATFRPQGCFHGMKTFLKILLLAALLIVAIKLSPVIFIGMVIGLFAAGLLGVVGVSLLVAFLAVALAFAVALSPIWIPVLVVMGLVSLFRRSDSKPATVTV